VIKLQRILAWKVLKCCRFDLDTVGVGGSNPRAPTIFIFGAFNAQSLYPAFPDSRTFAGFYLDFNPKVVAQIRLASQVRSQPDLCRDRIFAGNAISWR
jgi:hypothetical protein